MFQCGGNDWAYLSEGPSVGYIVGFIAATWLVGNLVVYVPGLLWPEAFGVVTWGSVFSKGMYPFIRGDVVKLLSASTVVGGLWTIADKRPR